MSENRVRKTPNNGRKRGRRTLRVMLVVSAVVLLSSVLLRIAAPHLISSSLVRSAIGSAVSGWTGHEVTIDGPPVITFWPEPRVTLTDISVHKSQGADAQLLAEVDELSASFGFYTAIRGQPQFSEFRFVRPRIRIERDKDGKLDWSNEGRLTAAVRDAHRNETGTQEIDPSLDAAVDSVQVVDGEVTLVDEASGREFLAQGLQADIDWAKLSSPLGAKASLSFEGRPLTLQIQTNSPLLLIGGEVADVALGLEVKGLSGHFQGKANLMKAEIGDGSLELNSADVPAFAAFSGLRLAGSEDWQTAGLKTNLVTTANELRFEDLSFQVNSTSGDGFLALTHPPQARPNLSGTLALERLDLAGLLRSLEIDIGNKAEARLPSVIDWVDFDVTVSAGTATFAPFELSGLGASLIGKGDSLKLVIGDAAFLGGSLSARFSRPDAAADQDADLSLSLEDINVERLIDGLQLDGTLPTGRGSIHLAARLPNGGPDGNFVQNIEAMSGTLRFRADDGVLRNFDADGLRAMAKGHAYFQLSAAGDEDFAFNQLDLTARFDHGSADIEKAEISGSRDTLTLSGIAPFTRQALALRAELMPNGDPDADEGGPLSFFIGGVWTDPVISPVPTVPPPSAAPRLPTGLVP
jgi:AsmA protein